MKLARLHFDSPTGKLTLVANEKALLGIAWDAEGSKHAHLPSDPNHPILRLTAKQLSEYFLGRRQIFELPLELHGTEFQKSVWQSLQSIPYGQTWSYGRLAKSIGNPKASRAVGGANNKNPIPIVVPCHRVIGASGSLVGFGGGLKAKEILLQIENSLPKLMQVQMNL